MREEAKRVRVRVRAEPDPNQKRPNGLGSGLGLNLIGAQLDGVFMPGGLRGSGRVAGIVTKCNDALGQKYGLALGSG